MTEVDASSGRSGETVTNAFLLTWAESRGWPHENILRMLEKFETDGYVDEMWRVKAVRQARIGDRVWLLKQGAPTICLFGMGTIITSVSPRDAGNGKIQPMAMIRFTRLVDPRQTSLIGDAAARRILEPNQIKIAASGQIVISPTQLVALDLAAGQPAKAAVEPEASDQPAFDPTDLEDARDRVWRSIAQRRGQPAFRAALISAYDGHCAITGCNVPDVLEAAQIVPYWGPDTNKTDNGLLLRADIHTLFDCGLISIDPSKRTVVVAKSLVPTEYGAFAGKTLRNARTKAEAPSAKALARRWEINSG